MRFKFLLLIFSVILATSVSAQSIFKPKPLPSAELKLSATATNPLVQNFWRPVVGVTASVSNGTQLAGGFGVSFQHDVFDTPSNSWAIQYSISALGFLGTNGSKITGTGGIVVGIPGTGGIVQIGPGYDFTNKQIVLLTGVGIPL